MNFRDLKAAVNAAQLHDLADTDAEAVRVEPTGLAIDFDSSHFSDEIEELKDDVERYVEDEKTMAARIETLEREAEEAKTALIAIRHDGDKATLADYIQQAREADERADKAEEDARQHKEFYANIAAELKAMRKKKGISANLFRQQSEILHVLGQMSTYPDDRARWQPRAKELLSKLHAK